MHTGKRGRAGTQRDVKHRASQRQSLKALLDKTPCVTANREEEAMVAAVKDKVLALATAAA